MCAIMVTESIFIAIVSYKFDSIASLRTIGLLDNRKNVFKTDTKIGKKYEKSPYYLGTKLWDNLPKETQFSDNVHEFKKRILPLYNTYVDVT